MQLRAAVPNTELRHRKPGTWDVTVRLGPDGLRDPRLLSSLPDDTLILLGDSFAWGYGVEEDERLSAHLERALGRPVFPLAKPGLTPPEEHALLREAEAKGAPAHEVLLLFVMENDLGLWSPVDGIAPPSPRGASTALGMLVRELVARSATLTELARDLGLKARPYDYLDREVSDAVLTATLDVVDDLCRDRQARVAVVPSRARFFDATRERERENQARLVAGLRELGLEVIELEMSLDDHFAEDPHWTPAGHAKAAAQIARALAR